MGAVGETKRLEIKFGMISSSTFPTRAAESALRLLNRWQKSVSSAHILIMLSFASVGFQEGRQASLDFLDVAIRIIESIYSP